MTSLFTVHEITHGEAEDSNTTRVGIKTNPWKGGQISSSIDQTRNENGSRLFSNLGLKQAWQIDEKWSVNGGMDQTLTFKHPGNTSINDNVAPASGTDNDFTAISVGVTYREVKWSLSSRIERRYSDLEDKEGIFIGIEGEMSKFLALSLGFSGHNSKNISGVKNNSGNLRLSLAYRPERTKWIVLNRLDFIYEEQKGNTFNYDNSRIVNNLNANYKPDWETQISFQYGAKYVSESIDSEDYSGYTDLIGLEGRHNITRKWDVGLFGSLLHSWEADHKNYRLEYLRGTVLWRIFGLALATTLAALGIEISQRLTSRVKDSLSSSDSSLTSTQPVN